MVRPVEENCAKGPFFLDTPNEMILAILEELPDKALVAMAGICHRVRPLSISVYLRRLGVLTSESGSQELRLSQTVPATVFLFLSSVHLGDDVTFTCDVFYLLEYALMLREFSVRTSITSVCLRFYSHEPAVLHAPKVACALSSFLGSLSTQCQFITVETLSFSAFASRQVSQSAGHLGGTAYDAGIRTLMSTARAIALTDDLFQTPSLAKVGSLLLEGPNVNDFGLTCTSMQKNRSGAILSQVNFPALQHLRLTTTIIPQMPTEFFRRHSSLYGLTLFGRQAGRSQHQPRSSRSSSRTVELPHLAMLTFSDRFLPWVSTLLCPNLRRVAIYPTRYWQVGKLVDSWSGLHACFNAVIHRGLSGDSMLIAMPDGEATIERDAMRAQTQFYTRCEGNCRVPKTSKLSLRLSDLKKESLKLVIRWATMFVHLRTLELFVRSGSAACSDPPEAEVQRFLTTLRQSLKEFNTLHCNMGTWTYQEGIWVRN